MLRVQVADRPEDLLDVLVAQLRVPLADPFASEWVSVPSLGFRSWLRHQLSLRLGAGGHGDGIVANVEMPFPGSLRWTVLRAHSAQVGRGDQDDIVHDDGLRDAGGPADQDDPWQVDRLVWSVLEVLSEPPPGLDSRLSRERLPAGVALASRARPIADLFDRYGVHRPAMLAAWDAGRDVDPAGAPLNAEHLWQPQLFRAVRDHITARHGVTRIPSERLAEALEMVRSGELAVTHRPGGALPERLFVFGPSVLPADMGPILQALGAHRDVTALLLSPAAAISVRLANEAAIGPQPLSERASWSFPRPSPQAQIVDHPLLESWATRPLEAALLWGAGGVVLEPVGANSADAASANAAGVNGAVADAASIGDAAAETTGAADADADHQEQGSLFELLHYDGAPSAPLGELRDDPGPDTLLGVLQRDLRAGAVSDGTWAGRTGDGSLQIHRAPGPTRQVEVLRDVILGLLRDHPELTESDIAVVCPQLESYAPVIGAVLGPSARRGEQPAADTVPALRYTAVDRNARSFNPVLDAMAKLLELLPGRFEVAAVGEVLSSPAVKARFGLDSADLALLADWAESSCVRWGLDSRHRERWGISADHHANSWAAGIDQLMMGVALGDDLRAASLPGSGAAGSGVDPQHALSVGGIVPMALDEGAIRSAGRLAAALRSLTRVHGLLLAEHNRTPEQWCRDLRTAADLMVAPQRFEEWQRERFDEALDDLLAASSGPDGAPSEVGITYGDMRRLLAPSLEGARARADMGFGSVVIARPSLIAGVPYRVVCVLGLDQEALPAGGTSGDDLAGLVPFVGDREPRSEARAELLSVLASARDHLVVTCTSSDVHTNAPVPASVLLDELIDVLATTVDCSPDEVRAPAAGVVRTHPRQAFDRRNFSGDGSEQPFSFDPTALAGAVALASAAEGPSRRVELLEKPLEPLEDPDAPIELSELRAFFAHPVKSFFTERLRLGVPRAHEEADVQLPTSLASLEISMVGRELLEVGLELTNPDDVLIDPETGKAGRRAQEVIDGFRALGLLPPPVVSHAELLAIAEEVAAMLTTAERYGVRCRNEDRVAHDLDVTLPGGIRLVGSVDGCIDGPAPGPVRVAFHRARPKQEISLAIDLLVLTVSRPEVAWRGVSVARPDRGKVEPVTKVRMVRGDDPKERLRNAVDALEVLVAQFRDGRCYPLPLFEKTSHEYFTGGKPAKAWNTRPGAAKSFAEADDAHHLEAFGPLDYAELVDIATGGYTLAGEARRLWGTLTAALVEYHDDHDEQGDR